MNAIASVGAQAKHFATSPVAKAVAITLGVYFLLMATQILPMFGITSRPDIPFNFLGGGLLFTNQTSELQAAWRYTHLLWGPLLGIALTLRFPASADRSQFLESVAIGALVSSFVSLWLIAVTAKGLDWASADSLAKVLGQQVFCLLPIAVWLPVWRLGLFTRTTFTLVLCFSFLNCALAGVSIYLLPSRNFTLTSIQFIELVGSKISLSLLGSSLFIAALAKCEALLAEDTRVRDFFIVLILVEAWAIYGYVILIFINGDPIFFNYVHIGAWTPLTLGLGICFIWAWHMSSTARLARLEQAALQQAQLEAGFAEASAATLSAQIEPHFLFNTLANVLRLKSTSHGKGKLLLSSLIAYFEAALPRLRRDGSSLNDELALVRAYLDILQQRMSERLTYSINVPDDFLPLHFPPMMLLTLVENAYKHGLMQMPSGGSVSITASRHANMMRIEVTDTGRGFQLHAMGGSGIGLSNVRARLLASFGTRASLDLAQGMQHGMIATLSIPIDMH